MTWFEELTGIRETSPAQVRAQLSVNGSTLTSLANRRSFTCGSFEMPSLAELRSRVPALGGAEGRPRLSERVGDARALHLEPANAGALFQVASQFNLLEMLRPEVTPEAGIGIYENDPTQGPACAVAAGAGTIYRNYLVTLGDQTGQSKDRQVDCASDLGLALGNADGRLWQMRNGYLLPTREGLAELCASIDAASPTARDELRGLLRIGLQWNTQVTLGSSPHLVTQAYCSAVPVTYSGHPPRAWEPFARLVLEAAYEATLCAAALNFHATGCDKVFLTLLGGGAFGNERSWIIEAIERALVTCRAPLDVVIVSFRNSDPAVSRLVQAWRA